MTTDFEKLAKLHVAIKAKIEAITEGFKAALEPHQKNLATLETRIIKAMDEAKTKNITTDFGQLLRETKVTPRLADGEVFDNFVKETGRLDFFQRRLNSSEIVAYIEANTPPGSDLVVPPGLSLYVEPRLGFRKARAKSKTKKTVEAIAAAASNQ